jgi:tetratricopeptide (TPR) repeat protein
MRRRTVALAVLCLVWLTPPAGVSALADERSSVDAGPSWERLAHEAVIAAGERGADEAYRRCEEAMALAGGGERGRLAAVVCARAALERMARADGQGAVGLFERATRAAAGRQAVEGLPPKTTSSLYSPPSDLFPPELDADVRAAAADPLLVPKLVLGTANAYALQLQGAPALHLYEQALTLPEAASSPLLRAMLLANAAELRLRLARQELVELDTRERRGEAVDADGVRARAEALLEKTAAGLAEAEGLLSAHGRALERRRILTMLGHLARARGDRERAESLYREAIALYHQAQDAPGRGRAQAGLGELLLQAGRFALAEAAFADAVQVGEASKDDALLWHAYAGLGQAKRSLHPPDLKGAVAALERALQGIAAMRGQLATDEGKVNVLEVSRRVTDAYVEAQLDLARTAPSAYARALEMIDRERGSATRDYLKGLVAHEGVAPGPAVCRSPEDRVQESHGIRSLTVLPEEPGPEADPRAPRREVGATATPPRRERIVFHVLPTRTAVFRVDRGGRVTGTVLPLGREALARRIQDFRQAIDRARTPRGAVRDPPPGAAPPGVTVEGLARQLSEALLSPTLRPRPARGSLLVLQPHDVLWELPFAALPVDGEPAGIRWSLLYSVREAVDAPLPPPAAPRVYALGLKVPSVQRLKIDGETFTFGELEGAQEEARELAALFSAPRIITTGGASVSDVVGELYRYDVIHLATHGVARSQRPLDSFLLLEPSTACGEALTARMVVGLRLRADLVVLSACETALGQLTHAEGMLGLGRAFLMANARTVIVSQWAVDDAATRALMVAFYRAYRAGQSKPDALRLAMAALRDDPRHPEWKSPVFWSPFIVLGAP